VLTPDRPSRTRHWDQPLAGNPEWRVVIRQRPDGLWESVLMDSDANMASSVGGFGTEAEAREFNEGEGT
jgi:hypothetical protein